MKLSEAILLGSMLRPQAFGVGYDGKGTCAWGAADEAVGIIPHSTTELSETGGWNRPEWRWTFDRRALCPECKDVSRVGCIISVHLNDQHYWTRERIAEWVATIEPQDQIVNTPIAEEVLCEVK